ncbi:unnamed protein product [Schistocephalus solidus]|uniref:TPR_REGION domain-containing protein n=1 Tax=Schistocephalus solidus TaxID=70667 RepID=A0A183SSU7_SCHSO|nr:unnamed protein product [Schistocephalus solidus]
MAEAYYRKGEFEEALTLFERGKRMRPSITAFQIGVYKCEQAIENNCGSPDLDLTAYYLHAFPPKVTRKAPEKKMGSKAVSAAKKVEKWPIDMPPEILNTLFGKEYPEYVYLRQLYEVEGKREKFLKQTGITLMRQLIHQTIHAPSAIQCSDVDNLHAQSKQKFAFEIRRDLPWFTMPRITIIRLTWEDYGFQANCHLWMLKSLRLSPSGISFLCRLGLYNSSFLIAATVLPRIQRCEDNRKDVMVCANCLNRKCDLWYKMDPSMKHDRRLM